MKVIKVTYDQAVIIKRRFKKKQIGWDDYLNLLYEYQSLDRILSGEIFKIREHKSGVKAIYMNRYPGLKTTHTPRVTYIHIGTCLTTGNVVMLDGRKSIKNAGFCPASVYMSIKSGKTHKGHTFTRIKK